MTWILIHQPHRHHCRLPEHKLTLPHWLTVVLAPTRTHTLIKRLHGIPKHTGESSDANPLLRDEKENRSREHYTHGARTPTYWAFDTLSKAGKDG